ncbi:hypothetical protein NKDENANG_01492 [Candidatus Entotheonellaceae bacterium PAL068K]
MYQKILVPLDGSKVAEVALPHAVQMAKLFKAELVVLRVAFALGFPGSDPVEAQSTVVEETDIYLAGVTKALQSRGLKASRVGRYGKAAEAIIDYAAHHDISIIIMATHGRSGVGRWLLGNTAEKVLRGTQVPILLIRASPGAETEPGHIEEPFLKTL